MKLTKNFLNRFFFGVFILIVFCSITLINENSFRVTGMSVEQSNKERISFFGLSLEQMIILIIVVYILIIIGLELHRRGYNKGVERTDAVEKVLKNKERIDLINIEKKAIKEKKVIREKGKIS